MLAKSLATEFVIQLVSIPTNSMSDRWLDGVLMAFASIRSPPAT